MANGTEYRGPLQSGPCTRGDPACVIHMRRKYSTAEIEIIVKHYPDLEKILVLLPERNRLSIRGKAGDLGLCKKRGADWSLRENRVVEKHYPDIDAIRELLPQRTRMAIKTRAVVLGLTIKCKRWTPAHYSVLPALCAEMTDKEVGAILGVSTFAICFQRKKLGLKKQAKTQLSRARVPLVQDIRDEADRRGLKIGKITKALGFRMLKFSATDTTMCWSSAAKMVSVFSGEL